MPKLEPCQLTVLLEETMDGIRNESVSALVYLGSADEINYSKSFLLIPPVTRETVTINAKSIEETPVSELSQFEGINPEQIEYTEKYYTTRGKEDLSAVNVAVIQWNSTL